MIVLARQIIESAAVTAGMPSSSVMDKPAKQNITLPVPRLELDYMPETLERSFQRIVKFNSVTDPTIYRTIRSRLYKRTLTVRAEVRSDDEAWMEAFAVDFIIALPGKTADENNNLVSIKAAQAVRGGFGSRMVEVFVKRSNAIHVIFTGMICRDDDLPFIRDVNVEDNISIN